VIDSTEYKARVLVQLTYPASGPSRYFCDASSDASGVMVKDAGGTVRMWEPRATSVVLIQDVGNLDGGMQRSQSNTIRLLTNWHGDGAGTDLLSDIITNRVEGATVTIWTRIASVGTTLEESVNDYQERFSGAVRMDGGTSVDVFGGVLSLQIVEADGPWTMPISTAVTAGGPDTSDGTQLPIIFGKTENGAIGIDVVAYSVSDITSNPKKFQFGTLGSASYYDNPTAVRVDGAAVTAVSPITDAATAGKWGNFDNSAGTFDINDSSGGFGTIGESTVVVIKALGIEKLGNAPTAADDVIQTIATASGWTAVLDTSQLAAWRADLTTATSELLGAFPAMGTNEPAMLGDVLDEAMRRTCSVGRFSLAGKFQCVLPGGAGSTLHTVTAIASIQVGINPSGDYANDVGGVQWAFSGNDSKVYDVGNASIEYPSENAAVARHVFKLDELKWQQNRIIAISEGRGELRAQQQIVSRATIPLPQVDTMLIGDRVSYDVAGLETTLGIGHVRTVRLDPAKGLAMVTAYHITWIG
jgi:hypothetical protein